MKDAHTFSLPSQGSVYSQSTICLMDGTCKLIVATLNRKVFCFELSMFHCAEPCGCVVIPQTRELQFTYIPSGAEIISIDAFNHSLTTDEFVIGITIIKSGESGSPSQYLNIYSDWEPGSEPLLDEMMQTCMSLKLDYIPYQLTHCRVKEDPEEGEEETVWLLGGSDRLVHIYRDDKNIHMYTEWQDKGRVFPEFANAFPSVPLWIDIHQSQSSGRRVSAVGCECGFLQVSVVELEENTESGVRYSLTQSWTTEFDGPLTSTKLFNIQPREAKIPEFFADNFRQKLSESDEDEPLHLVVTYALGHSLVFHDILSNGLAKEICLPDSAKFDTVTCCCMADLQLSGRDQIVLGTYGQELLVFSQGEEGGWMLDWQRSLQAPILAIQYADLTGDGAKELIVITTQGAQVLQQDLNHLKATILERVNQLANKLGIDPQQVTDTFRKQSYSSLANNVLVEPQEGSDLTDLVVEKNSEI